MRLGPRARCSIRSTSDSSLPAGPQARYKGKTNAGPIAMANDTLINLLAWCKREPERLQIQRELQQPARFRIFLKLDSNHQRDTANQHIAPLPAYFSEIHRIIMAAFFPYTTLFRSAPGARSAPHRTAVCRLVLKRATRAKQMQELVPWPMTP